MKTVAIYLFCAILTALAIAAFVWARRLIQQKAISSEVTGIYRGMQAHEAEWSFGFRYSVLVDYTCPFTGEEKSLVGKKSEQGNDWRETGDPVRLYVAKVEPHSARIAGNWMIEFFVACIGFCLAVMFFAILVWKI